MSNGLRLVSALILMNLACGSAAHAADPAGMTQESLAEVIRSIDPKASGSPDGLELTHDEVRMVCISDRRFGRMRIIAPIRSVADLSPEQVAAILDANYHSALDARYATSQGILYAAFIHPLGPLTAEEVRSAVRQVASLVQTFGSTYSSGELVYSEPGKSL